MWTEMCFALMTFSKQRMIWACLTTFCLLCIHVLFTGSNERDIVITTKLSSTMSEWNIMRQTDQATGGSEPTRRPHHNVSQQEGVQTQHPTMRRVIKTGGNHNKKGTQKTRGVKAVLSSALPEEIITGENINEGDSQETEGVTLSSALPEEIITGENINEGDNQET